MNSLREYVRALPQVFRVQLVKYIETKLDSIRIRKENETTCFMLNGFSPVCLTVFKKRERDRTRSESVRCRYIS
jgi:hypothetical protein